MKILSKLFILLIFLSFSWSTITAQEAPQEHFDVVYLKDGSKFYGQIISYDEQLKFKILGGAIIEVSTEKVRKIVQETKLVKLKEAKIYNFKENGLYQSISIGAMPESSSRTKDLGYNLHTSLGYQMHRLFGLGIGIGIDNYAPGGWEKIYPVYLESRGYLNKKNTSLYYNMSAGYGFTFKNEEFNVIEALGGMYLNPNIGVRLGGSDQANFYMEAGVKLQKAKFRIDRRWDLIRQDVRYQRFSFKIGLLL